LNKFFFFSWLRGRYISTQKGQILAAGGGGGGVGGVGSGGGL